MLGCGIFALIPQGEQFIDTILVPFANNTSLDTFAILLIVLGSLILFGAIVVLMVFRLDDSRFVRVNHDGFFFPHLLSTVVKWSEISALEPYVQGYLGQQVIALAIVPQDPEEILTRIFAEKSRNFVSRFFAQINRSFYHRSRARSPLQIPQVLLPISIDDFISLIRERFANELNEHHVAILEWQD